MQAGAGLASLVARWKALKLGGPAGELRVSRLAGTRGPALAVKRITMCMPCTLGVQIQAVPCRWPLLARVCSLLSQECLAVVHSCCLHCCRENGPPMPLLPGVLGQTPVLQCRCMRVDHGIRC